MAPYGCRCPNPAFPCSCWKAARPQARLTRLSQSPVLRPRTLENSPLSSCETSDAEGPVPVNSAAVLRKSQPAGSSPCRGHVLRKAKVSPPPTPPCAWGMPAHQPAGLGHCGFSVVWAGGAEGPGVSGPVPQPSTECHVVSQSLHRRLPAGVGGAAVPSDGSAPVCAAKPNAPRGTETMSGSPEQAALQRRL